jgi:hypothetical protein
MALLLRFNGVPARVVLGFAQGDRRDDGVFVVRRDDAHAWVEAYFPGVGWKEFDPTPGRSLPAPSSQAGGAVAGAGGAGQADTPGGAALPNARGKERANDPGGAGDLSGAPSGTPARWPWAFALVAALAGWPAGRALLRRRGLLASSPEGRVRVRVRLLYATLRDHGLDVPASQTLEETAGLLHARYGVDAGGIPARVDAIVFGGLPASEDDVAALRALRRRVGAGLRRGESRAARLAGLYGLRRHRPLTPPSAPRDGGFRAEERGASPVRV